MSTTNPNLRFLGHFNGADGSKSFSDDSTYSNTVTNYSELVCELDTAQKKFGTASLMCDLIVKDTEAGTNETNIKITNHGLSINDKVILRDVFNIGDAYVTTVASVVDADNFTVTMSLSGTRWLTGDTDVIPVMTSNTTPSGIASTDEAYSSSYAAWKAMDSSLTTDWVATSKHAWLAYEFTSSKVIVGYLLRTRGSFGTAAPKNWTFEGWNGSTWDTLDTRTNETSWANGESRSYSFSNSTAYIKYRINVTDNNGHNEVGLSNFEMFEAVDGSGNCIHYYHDKKVDIDVTGNNLKDHFNIRFWFRKSSGYPIVGGSTNSNIIGYYTTYTEGSSFLTGVQDIIQLSSSDTIKVVTGGILESITTISDDTWYFIEYAVSPYNHYLYINGILEDSESLDNSIDLTSHSNLVLFDGNVNDENLDSTTSQAWIDDLQFWEGTSIHDGENYLVPTSEYSDNTEIAIANNLLELDLAYSNPDTVISSIQTEVEVAYSNPDTVISWLGLEVELAEPFMVSRIKKWNGSEWVSQPIKKWDGSEWVTKPVKKWSGSEWV